MDTPHSDRILILINPNSSHAHNAWLRIREILTAGAVVHEVKETAAQGEGETITRAALEAGYQTIAVVGGDGTLSEAVRGFFEEPGQEGSIPRPVNSAASLAILPAGTGNDFARGLTAGRSPINTWIERLVSHCRQSGNVVTTRVVDTIFAEVSHRKSFVCLNAATVGISADVAARVSLQAGFKRRLPGEVRFALEGIRALKSWRNYAVQLIVDGKSMTCDTSLIVVANGVFVGGGMKVAPNARPDDGKLEALTVCGLSRLEVLREFTHLHSGGHVGNQKIVMLSGSDVRIETAEGTAPLPIEADGDVRGHSPAVFRIMPKSLRIVW